jgi:CheY-like chemotaxis protein
MAPAEPESRAGLDVFRRFVSAAPLGLMVVDDRSTIQYANPAAGRMLARRVGDLIGEVFDPRAVTASRIEIRDAESGRTQFKGQGGPQAPESPGMRLLILTDRAEAAALAEARALAGSVAHDVNNLLSAAFSYIEEIEQIAGAEMIAGASKGLRQVLHETAAQAGRLFQVAGVPGGTTRGRDVRDLFAVDAVASDEPLQRGALVVDDDPAVRALTARVLRTLGLEAVERGSVDEAFAYVEGTDRAVGTILVDAMMPGPGIEHVCRELRGLQPEARILVMSGAPSVEDVVAAVADGFIAKPFSVAELGAALASGGRRQVGRAA